MYFFFFRIQLFPYVSTKFFLLKTTFGRTYLGVRWCSATRGANLGLFSTWWMRSPLWPSTASAAVPQKENVAPVHSLHSFLMVMAASCRNTHTYTPTLRARWERVKAAVHKEAGWPVKTLSAELWALKHYLEGLLMRETGAPSQELFSPPSSFQGRMPRAINIERSQWIEKADVPHSGLKEVRAERNAFRDALRDM